MSLWNDTWEALWWNERVGLESTKICQRNYILYGIYSQCKIKSVITTGGEGNLKC